MAGTSAHHEEVEDFVAAEILMLTVENRKLQCIDHTTDCVNDSAGEKPSEFCTCQIVEDLTECEDTDPFGQNTQNPLIIIPVIAIPHTSASMISPVLRSSTSRQIGV